MNLHRKPFGESTLAKLEIFEQYTVEWLPVFLMRPIKNTVVIADFFAGPGYDKNLIEGSPIRILNVVRSYLDTIIEKKITVRIYFNEYDKSKFSQLKESCDEYMSNNPAVDKAIHLHLINEDFNVVFDKLYDTICRYPSLLFLDQNGVKFLSIENLMKLEHSGTTDFLYFVSSSYLWRFGDKDEFKRHFNFDLEAAKQSPYRFIHRILLQQLKAQLPRYSELKLYPFTIKKEQKIYGLIFGSKNALGVEKFLRVAWKNNPLNGSANFDIDEDLKKVQMDLFGGKLPTKMEFFCEKLEDLIRENKEVTNKDIYLFTLEKGHIPPHARTHLQYLKKESKVIDYQGKSPKIGFDSLKKNDYIVSIKWLTKK